MIDQSYGYIEAQGRPTIEWSFGFSESQPLCHQKCNTVWQREESLGGQKREVGLMRDAGKRVHFVMDQWISFRVDATSQDALEYLRQTVSGYHRRDEPQKCERPEIEERSAF